MSHRYLIRWSPYKVVKVLVEGEHCEVPEGCDIVTEPIHYIEEKFEKWHGDIDWGLVMELYRKGDFKEIFKIHNNHNWSDDYYCCDKHRKNVVYNVGLYENSRL